MKSKISFPKRTASAQELAHFFGEMFYKANKKYGVSDAQIIPDYPYTGYYTVYFENVEQVPFVQELEENKVRINILEVQVPVQKKETDFEDIRMSIAYARENDKRLLLVINRDYFFLGSNQIHQALIKDKIIIFTITENVLCGLFKFLGGRGRLTLNEYLIRQYFGIVEGKCQIYG